MAQNLVFFYALIIFLSQFLVAGMSFFTPFSILQINLITLFFCSHLSSIFIFLNCLCSFLSMHYRRRLSRGVTSYVCKVCWWCLWILYKNSRWKI